MGRKRKWITGWRVFILVVLLVLVLLSVDDRFVRAAAAQGFYPDDTYLMVSSWDFPRALTALDSSDALTRMKDDWPRPYRELELAARLETGIRPTPNRWGVWLGRRSVCAIAPEGIGITAYPGHLLRWADALKRIAGYGPGADGIARYRDIYYAWRNGYLVASRSREYVEGAVKSNSAPRLHSESEALLTVQWEGTHRGYLNLKPGAGLPISGQIEFAVSDGERPMTLPQAWPTPPAISVTARSVDDMTRAWSAVDDLFSGFELYTGARQVVESTVHAWDVHAPDGDWGGGVDHASFALFGADARFAVPIPDIAFAMRYAEEAPEANPFSAVFANRPSIPFEWNQFPGSMVPLLGGEWSPCVARTSHEWIMTSREPLMADLAGNLSDGPACAAEADVAVRVSWKQLGKCVEVVAAQLADSELFPRMNGEDFRAEWLPRITAMSKLGALAIDGVARGGTLKFSGNLAKAAEGEAP